VKALSGRATARFAGIKDAMVFVPPPAVELGNATGCFELEDAPASHDRAGRARPAARHGRARIWR
jgi:hypothetical protein